MTDSSETTLFLAGDVMLGRGIDQILPHPGDPTLFEGYMRSAEGYVRLAEAEHGTIPRPVGFDCVWGDALGVLEQRATGARIVNLETAVTESGAPEPKGINYRMHPDNFPCVTAAGIDCCVLANNHVLDWGEAGLRETLETIAASGVKAAGAGRDAEAAAAPARIPLAGGGAVLVFAFGSPTSGIPPDWAAKPERPGVALLPDLSPQWVETIAEHVRRVRSLGDIVVVSIHWGGNWGYAIPGDQRRFAQGLIERAGVDIVHGHSSHHPKGIEVHQGRPIIYGAGDFIDDYEGIRGHEQYRGDLTLMYLLTMDRAEGGLRRLEMVPFRIRRFRLEHAPEEDARWLAETLDRESRPLGVQVALGGGNVLRASRQP